MIFMQLMLQKQHLLILRVHLRRATEAQIGKNAILIQKYKRAQTERKPTIGKRTISRRLLGQLGFYVRERSLEQKTLLNV